MWLALLLTCAGVAAVVWAGGRVHDVFGDGTVGMPEWQLTKAVTVGGPRRPDPQSELDLAIAQFLGDDAARLMSDESPATPEPDSGAKTQDDFCPT